MRGARVCVAGLIAPCVICTIGTICNFSAAGAQTSDGQKPRSARDGVYTLEQAQRGAAAYARACAECHGATLTNDEGAAPLAGRAFIDAWKPYSAGDLFERMRKTMPTAAPGSLGAREYVDILAQILRANGYPAGNTEMEERADVLR